MIKAITPYAAIALIALAGAGSPARAQDDAPNLSIVPEATLNNMESLFSKPPGETREEMLKNFNEQLQQVLTLGARAELDYPDATNLYKARELMLKAAGYLASREQTKESAEQVRGIAQRILASDAPAEVKFRTDFRLTQFNVLSPAGERISDSEIDKQVRAFVSRYMGTDDEPRAVVAAVMLAAQTDRKALTEEYIKLLKTKYAENADAQAMLQRLGLAGPVVGKPFKAELTKLDGGKLSLPGDLAGKVVVIDFWATWCGPCVATLPHVKEVYAQYKDKGVEIVGISLDDDRSRLENFVQTNGLSWIITYTGQGWDDPTAKLYGIRAIPAVWVLDKQGKVVSTNARNNLAATIEKALEKDKIEEEPADQK